MSTVAVSNNINQYEENKITNKRVKWWDTLHYEYKSALRGNKKDEFIVMLRFDYEGNFIDKKYINKQTSMQFGYNYTSLLAVSLPSSKVPSYKGYIWIRQQYYSEEELQRRVSLRKSKATKDDRTISNSKKIVQIDIDTRELINIWPSISSVNNEGYDAICVIAVLKDRRKTYLNCIWVYFDDECDYKDDKFVSHLINSKISNIKNRGRKVKQICASTGKVINIHPSICCASRATGISETSIRRMIKGIKSKYTDFLWEVC